MKVKKIAALVAAIVFIAGCSTNPKIATITNPLEARADIKKQEVKFLETYGHVVLQFDENGEEWLSLESTGTAPLNFNHANSREEAFMVANMRAQRNLIEFLSSSIKSDKFTDSISKVVLDDTLVGGTKDSNKPTEALDALGDKTVSNKSETASQNDESRSRANKVAQTVKETINQSANGILKGTMIIDRKIDAEVNMVAVTIKVSKKSINTSRKIRNQMDGV
jgi:hypothetical protein